MRAGRSDKAAQKRHQNDLASGRARLHALWASYASDRSRPVRPAPRPHRWRPRPGTPGEPRLAGRWRHRCSPLTAPRSGCRRSGRSQAGSTGSTASPLSTPLSTQGRARVSRAGSRVAGGADEVEGGVHSPGHDHAHRIGQRSVRREVRDPLRAQRRRSTLPLLRVVESTVRPRCLTRTSAVPPSDQERLSLLHVETNGQGAVRHLQHLGDRAQNRPR